MRGLPAETVATQVAGQIRGGCGMTRRLAMRANDDRGFTLVELITVMVILGLLAGIAIPLFLNQRSTAFETQIKSDLHNAATAEESYALHHDGSYLTTGTGAD